MERNLLRIGRKLLEQLTSRASYRNTPPQPLKVAVVKALTLSSSREPDSQIHKKMTSRHIPSRRALAQLQVETTERATEIPSVQTVGNLMWTQVGAHSSPPLYSTSQIIKILVPSTIDSSNLNLKLSKWSKSMHSSNNNNLTSKAV